ncbi:MAG: 30S ribosomal protein S4 [Phycisphaerales bacterium]|nr:30S ribosomal protein S4 [Phycisphaerales bacterium]
MARYRDAVCRLCRREGVKLFLKGDRCYTEKCAIERRSYVPGDHGQTRRTKLTNYAIQLREKQKAKRTYGVLEKQFRNYFKKAASSSGVTGEALLQILETRIDNVIYRLGFGASRAQSRQLVRHRHVTVNGRIVDIPSYNLRPNDVVAIKESSRSLVPVQAALEGVGRRGELPDWMEVNEKTFSGRITRIPSRDVIPTPIAENLIVELYSK